MGIGIRGNLSPPALAES